MMESNGGVTLMIMFEDESVEVRFGTGAQVQLSPCGSDFLLVKRADPAAHPLQPAETVRQRTRFTISKYKELMVTALAFRNKYARRPYLLDEFTPTDHKKPFFSVNSEVQWPQASLCQHELGPRGETIIRSDDGHAALMLSPSGEDFTVQYTCSLSQLHNRLHQPVSNVTCHGEDAGRLQTTSDEIEDHQQSEGNSSAEQPRSCSCPVVSISHAKQEEMFQSTTVVQHFSCCAVSPTWSYPLSLARHHWAADINKPPGDIRAERNSTHTGGITPGKSPEERRCHLPRALPLTCPTPHWHRDVVKSKSNLRPPESLWKVRDPFGKREPPEQDLPTELVKVMWCQGVTYRILSGAVSIVEVSPGDGSVIRSNGVLNSYFTHFKPDCHSGQVKEVTYHLNSLPPDVPGQPYSVLSVVNRANRILTCYNQAKHSLKLPAAPSCLQEERDLSEPNVSEETLTSTLSVNQHIIQSRSDHVAEELEKIKRFNFLLENSHLLRGERSCAEADDVFAEDLAPEPVNESCIAEALQRTSKAIQDIDTIISTATLTP